MTDELRFRIDVQNKRVSEDIEDAIEQGIKDAIGRGPGGGLADKIERAAREKIFEHERVWRGKLLDSFNTYTYRSGDDYYLVVENTAPHARTTEYGRTPGEEKPPLEALIPWVEQHLDDWDVDPDYLGEGGGGGPDPPDSSFIKELPRDASITGKKSAADAGLEDSANSDSIFIYEYDNGERTIFKANSRSPSWAGVDENRNEAAFSKIANELGFEIAPEAEMDTRYLQRNTPDTRFAGINDAQNMREEAFPGVEYAFIEGAQPLFQERIDGRDDVDIINDYRDTLAETSALDMVVGNTDRHSKNYIVSPDNRLVAIDNGGHNESEDTQITTKMVRGPSSLYSERSDEMYEAVQDLIQAQNEAVGEVVAHSDIIIERLRQEHGGDHWVVERAEELLANDGAELWDQLSQLQDDWLSTVDPDQFADMPEPDQSDMIEDLTIVEDIKEEFEDL